MKLIEKLGIAALEYFYDFRPEFVEILEKLIEDNNIDFDINDYCTHIIQEGITSNEDVMISWIAIMHILDNILENYNVYVEPTEYFTIIYDNIYVDLDKLINDLYFELDKDSNLDDKDSDEYHSLYDRLKLIIEEKFKDYFNIIFC